MDKVTKQRVQNQLRQFLKDFRNGNNLSAEQAAERLEVEIATYRILEGRKPANRVLSVLEYLEKIASLNKMSLSAFIGFLERTQRTESGSLETKRTLYEWERDVLDKFDFVGIPLRNRFLKGFLEKSKEEVREILTCLTRIVSLPEAKRRALFNLVKEMVSDA
ncbi:MAG: hypothetical protein HYW48_09080 [Deltaproteobacteria bacterium]|nr:hypothetical protein [Deltaproteobacteria bacterium]